MKENGKRPGCVDVYRARLVSDAHYTGEPEIPVLQPTGALPTMMRPFSQAINSGSDTGWVHFYEDDVKFERIWNAPKRYIKALSKFDGIITPDFSVYRDMPKVMQEWNIYRSHALGYALQKQGCNVIANLRYGDERTFGTACLGVPEHACFAVGTHGNLKDVLDRMHFIEGLEYAVKRLKPKTIIVYGSAPEAIFGRYRRQGIRILQFESTFAQAHRRGC